MRIKLSNDKKPSDKIQIKITPPMEDTDEFLQTSLSSSVTRSYDEPNNHYREKSCCRPSLIPIGIVFILIFTVVLLPLLDPPENKNANKLKANVCSSTTTCSIQLTESIPIGLEYPPDSPSFTSTFDSWQKLIKLASEKIEIGSFYWTLRGEDFYNHSSARLGEEIFNQLLDAGLNRKIDVKIAQSLPTQGNPSLDTEVFVKKHAANVRSVNFPKLVGGGVLHTKLIIVDRTHFYVGSANMDWRSLTQVKELGVIVQNCSCLAKDIAKIFDVYWDMGEENATIPTEWPEEYATTVNATNPMMVKFNNEYNMQTFLSSSPPPMTTYGRSNDIDAILDVIFKAQDFVHISVMDYFPLTLYTPKRQFWPIIDDALRKVAIEKAVSVKLLISWWKHSRPAEDNFLRSLEAISESYKNVDIQIKRFIVPADEDQEKIPFGRVNHNKYMVTDNTAYIGTSNWSGDYFIDTAGIGLIMSDGNGTISNIRSDLASIFQRDWNSKYAVDLK